MQLKVGVDLHGVQPPTFFALGVAYAAYWKRFPNQDITVTSLWDDHISEPASLHLVGLACDLRIRNIPATVLADIFADIDAMLNPLGYDTLMSVDHIHCEYDPKRGESWIKTVA